MIRAVLLACAMAPLTACAGPAELDTTAWAVVETLPADGVVHAGQMHPLPADAGTAPGPVAPDQVAYDTVDGETMTVTVAATDLHGARFAVTYGADRIEYVRRTAEGAVELVAVLDHRETALTRFEPGLVVAPATLDREEESRTLGRAHVVNAETGAARANGNVTMTVRRLDDAMVAGPEGTRRYARAAIRFDARFGPARAEDETVLWIAPGSGVVVRDESNRVVVLGLTTRDVSRRWIRARHPVAP